MHLSHMPGLLGTPAGGAVYVRWGRKSCPDNTSLVYNGTAAGSHEGADGISDIFCMPEDPSYNHVVDSVGRSRHSWTTSVMKQMKCSAASMKLMFLVRSASRRPDQ